MTLYSLITELYIDQFSLSARELTQDIANSCDERGPWVTGRATNNKGGLHLDSAKEEEFSSS